MKYIGLVALVLSLGVASPSPSCGDDLYQPTVLDGSSWILTGMGDAHDNLRGVSQTPPVTLAFHYTGPYGGPSMLEGSTGCRDWDYSFGYQLGNYDDDGFLISMVGSLSMPPGECPTPELSQREGEYIDSLTNARRAVLSDDGRRLVIEAEDGRVLIFGP